MTALEILPLEEVKNYLKVDFDYQAEDDEIERMIKGAISFIEKYTNIELTSKVRIYEPAQGEQFVKVFSYPFTVISTDAHEIKYSSYSKFSGKVSLELGFESRNDIPEDILQSAKAIIKVWYEDTEKGVNDSIIPASIKTVLDTHRRFIM